VTVGVLLVGVLWLLPCAWLAVVYPAHAAWIAMLALIPVVLGAVGAGAGRRESGPPLRN
jgi:uncharacterized membrane protein